MIHLMSGRHHLDGLTTFGSDIATRVAAGELRDGQVEERHGRCMPPLVRVFEKENSRENFYKYSNQYRAEVDLTERTRDKNKSSRGYKNLCNYFSDRSTRNEHEIDKYIFLESTEERDMDYMLKKQGLEYRDIKKKHFFPNGIVHVHHSKSPIYEKKNGYGKLGKFYSDFEIDKLKFLNNKIRMADYEDRPHEFGLEEISEGVESNSAFDYDITRQAYRKTESFRQPDITRSVSLQVADDDPERGFMSYRRCHSFSPGQKDGMMDKGKEEGAINLSTAGKETDSDGPITNGDLSKTTSEEPDNTSQGYGQGMSQVNSDFTSTQLSTAGSSKRKSKPSNLSASEPGSPVSSGVQSVLMLAAQHGLSPQQMSQLLQHHQGALPQQLTQLMQQQQSFIVQQQQQKAQEQLLLQLNEQLQLNVLQQSQLLQQQEKNKTSSGGKQIQQTMQQLALQQQALVQQIQQIQLQQRQFLLACLAQQPFGAPQGVISPSEIQQLWKEAAEPGSEDQMKGLNGVTPGSLHPALLGLNGLSHEGFPLAGPLIGQPQVSLTSADEEKIFSPLYRHKLCKWPGCDKFCEDSAAFTKHLNGEHTLDDRNTAQARVQMQVVSQLEIQLAREKELLHAMMQHLHLKPLRDREERENRAAEKAAMTSPKMTSPVGSPSKPSSLPVSSPKPHIAPLTMATMTSATSGLPISSGHPMAATLPVTSGLPPLVIPPQSLMTSVSKPPTPQSQSSSQPATPTGLGPIRRRVSDKCNLPISAEIQRNREFYKSTDVRPPFTYASLIRQAIIESENKQLTLNEVYQWFQNTFAYFRRNEATWKNAVRHNLSLHKCFMRVENVKGAVWTVDEIEFYKRRPQKLSGAMSNSPLTPDAGIYGDTINASLRAALEHSSMLMNQQLTNGSLSDAGAEDLSMKSYNSSNDSFSKSDSPVRDEIFMKHEHLGLQEEVVGGSSPRSNLSSHGNPSPREHHRSPQPRHLSPTARGSPMMKHMDRNDNEDTGRYNDIKMDTEYEALDMQIKSTQSEALDMSRDSEVKEEVLTKDDFKNGRHVNDSLKKESSDIEETVREEFSLRESDDDEKRRAQIEQTAREIELLRKASSGVSPHSPRELDHFSANQEPYSHLMHPSSVSAVSHSITS